ncbi:tyrosine aminotransferase [Acrasis kona]|uniref:Tyrosine aminotransferase n=1 Tax=Acrasis kona TaxID=1008807 RepID=A0AAW2ZMD9_9EUKA
MDVARGWNVTSSPQSLRTINPIQQITSKLDMKNVNKDKVMIPLSLGDPTVFGNMDTDDFLVESITKHAKTKRRNGYTTSPGFPDVRAKIAEKYKLPNHQQLTQEDVMLANGASGALDIVIAAIAGEGDNILLPIPSFPLYETLCCHRGIEPRFYQQVAEQDWQVDLQQLESQMDNRTKAILVNNPSNPCGSVWSQEHMKQIISIARNHCVPIIADEIYANMVFGGAKFTYFAEISDDVPIISINGIAKQYVVPGWRTGWLILYDKLNYLKELRDGLFRMTTLLLGPNTLSQAVIPDILDHDMSGFCNDLNKALESNAKFTCEKIKKIEGLTIFEPKGAFYTMVGIDVDRFSKSTQNVIFDDVSFSQELLKEESVFVLPGQCFKMKNYFRIVFCAPVDKLKEAYDRIESFCNKKLKLN